jgi:2-amino-4-hydroxy-6-hydroxymethyldihydropteridine diphosphokinase
MKYAVGVGSNRGDRAATINAAAQQLGPDIQLLASAPLLATAPCGGPLGQEWFLNGAWVVETDLGPHQVLHRLQAIETALGRTRAVRWGSRTLDLDLLLREDGLQVANSVLTLPHPRLAERGFVLAPLAQIAGAWLVPGQGATVAELWSQQQAAAQRRD